MTSNSITLNVTPSTLDALRKFYSDRLVPFDNPYIDFAAKEGKIQITAYLKEHNGTFKVVFMGPGALDEARIWEPKAEYNEVKEKVKKQWLVFDEHIGSDEVGTGDFFGPITVVGAYVTKEDIKELKKLGIDDSKRLTDEFILSVGPTLVKKFHYSSLTLDNPKYNALVAEGYNMNSLKAMLHNRALFNLQKQFGKEVPVYVDQFCVPAVYYKYLAQEKNVVRDIHFKTKGESYFPAVALASVIARYSFLLKMDAMGKTVGQKLPYGASATVDAFCKKLLREISIEAFDSMVKKNFKNYSRIVNP